MALHFSGEAVEDQFYTDFGNLNKLQDEKFQTLMVLVFEFLASPQTSSQFISNLEKFASDNGLGSGALKNLIKTVLVFFKAALKRNLPPTQLKEDLLQLGLSEEKGSWVAAQWKTNLGTFSKIAVGQSLTVNQLVDMEWRFGVTAADSEMKKVGNTYLQLKLVLDKGIKTEEVFMELTLPQFYSFLHEMEKAKAGIEYLT
ncbi:PREDICTED: COMM domain-containing protein 7-like [Amphimedon queenslandica]|uniref:COMM domain-containing protein n=1 Tax=Amphimedon queenslandica TaxID=400682 RepID=A0AAN0JGR3_AMPQE|nr:PREDICTED: COMM domain-containing protein 7-like [Amphimedon queenslandica]|eukprot:XP_019855833.1 PREDICTED: COMM domain-containing protein 7-like [Amphimedon queenslandica]